MLKTIGQNMAGQAQGMATKQMMQGMSKASKTKFIKYLLGSFFISILVSAFCFLRMIDARGLHLILMGVFILLSFWNDSLTAKRFEWSFNDVFWAKFFFNLLQSANGFLGFALGYYLFSKFLGKYYYDPSLMWIMASSVIAFNLPMLIKRTAITAISIPPIEYKKWFFPDKPVVMDKDNPELKNFAVVTFVFSRIHNMKTFNNFQSKAPYVMKLGDLFYFFIQEWNFKNQGKEIQFLDEENKTFGWYFYVKDKWWQDKKYLDPDFTILQNEIKVNQIIRTERVLL